MSPGYPGRAGRVWLVGAGPGDAGLITVEGRRRLREADLVVVDRLAPPALLAEVRPDAEVVDVGKVRGDHPVPQPQINALLVAAARAGRTVVRLKGGDPFLFGRGGEEAEACRRAGVPVDVVPGVSSALAAPAAAGIPVTHRGTSSCVTVVSGHDVLEPDRLRALVALGGTVVVLMGVHHLTDLAAGLADAGADPATPAAVVERAWTPAQRVVTAPLADLAATAAAAEVRSPAVIVIGDVAAFAASGAVTVVTGPPAPEARLAGREVA